MNKGAIYAVSAYTLWGFFPIYFKALHLVPALQIVGQRVVWSFVFLMVILALRKEFPMFRSQIKARKTLLIYIGAAVLLAINWLTYIWGVNNGYVLEASLGYFINPLVSVLLGVIFLGERPRAGQWLAVSVAAGGVVYLTLAYGRLPWIALVLALTFGLYGFVKKTAPLGSLYGLSLETTVMVAPAFIFLFSQEINGVGAFGHLGLGMDVLMILGGALTAIPLLLFSAGARLVPLTLVGILQYISPTIQFLLGVFLFGEDFTPARLVGFSLIWAALVIFTGENFLVRRKPAEATG